MECWQVQVQVNNTPSCDQGSVAHLLAGLMPTSVLIRLVRTILSIADSTTLLQLVELGRTLPHKPQRAQAKQGQASTYAHRPVAHLGLLPS